MPAETGPGDAPASPDRGGVRRALAVYSLLRLGLIAVLSLVAWVVGLPWLPAVTTGVVVAALLSLVVLRRPMRRLAGALAGSRVAPTAPPAPGVAAVTDADDPYAYDPYADDGDDDDDEAPLGEPPAQAASTSASPTSRP